jgi:hypothetical protein
MAGMSTAMARFPFPWLLACRGWQLFANHPPKETMSFASRFNLTANVISVVTFSRAKQPALPLRGRHLQ